eukprot:1158297-Pelagomonas_calceolata.AAC.4
MTPAAPSPCAFSPAPSPFPELPNAPGAGLLLSPVPPAPPLRTERAWCILCCRPSGVEKAELAMRAATSASRAAVCDASALRAQACVYVCVCVLIKRFVSQPKYTQCVCVHHVHHPPVI